MIFNIGEIVGTPAAVRALNENYVLHADLLDRHVAGDWGDLSDEDKLANETALVDGDRLLSAYLLPGLNEKVYIVTEADRSHTTIMLASEY